MIGLIDGSEMIGFKSWQADREESRKLTPNIANMLEESEVKKNEIDSVYIVIGPGSFTAVRIGFIVGRAFAEGLGADLYECNSFEFLSGLFSDQHEFLELKAGGGKIYKIKTSDASFEISEPGEYKNVSDTNLVEMFKENFESILNIMDLVEDIESLEPLYVKEPNITKPKG